MRIYVCGFNLREIEEKHTIIGHTKYIELDPRWVKHKQKKLYRK